MQDHGPQPQGRRSCDAEAGARTPPQSLGGASLLAAVLSCRARPPTTARRSSPGVEGGGERGSRALVEVIPAPGPRGPPPQRGPAPPGPPVNPRWAAAPVVLCVGRPGLMYITIGGAVRTESAPPACPPCSGSGSRGGEGFSSGVVFDLNSPPGARSPPACAPRPSSPVPQGAAPQKTVQDPSHHHAHGDDGGAPRPFGRGGGGGAPRAHTPHPRPSSRPCPRPPPLSPAPVPRAPAPARGPGPPLAPLGSRPTPRAPGTVWRAGAPPDRWRTPCGAGHPAPGPAPPLPPAPPACAQRRPADEQYITPRMFFRFRPRRSRRFRPWRRRPRRRRRRTRSRWWRR